MYEDAHTAPTGAKVLECWFTQGETTYRLNTKATPRAEVEKLLKVEQDAFELIETLSKKLADARLLLLLSKGDPCAPPKNQKYRCGKCDECLVGDCGCCASCLDKPKFGGRGFRKQACLMRRCAFVQKCAQFRRLGVTKS